MISRNTSANRLLAWQNERATNAHGLAHQADRAIAALQVLCICRPAKQTSPAPAATGQDGAK